jgi:hypothetical protein
MPESPDPIPPALPASRRDLGVGLVAVLVLLGVPIVIALVRSITAGGLPTGDFAIIEMSALDVPSHLPLVGVYSRFGFHHPGPIIFYLAAVPVRLFGPDGLAITAAAINLAAVTGLVVALYRRGGQVLVVLGAAMSLLVIHALGSDVVSIWNPYLPILALALAVVLTWSVWERDWWSLAWLAVVVTFVVQSHLGFAPTGAFLLGSSTIWALWQGPRRGPAPAGAGRCPAKVLIVSGAVLFMMWLPPLVAQVTEHPGNLTAILKFSGSGRQVVGASDGLGILSHMIGLTTPLFSRTTLGVVLLPVAPVARWSLAAVLVLFVVAAVVAARRGAHDALRLQALVAALVPIGWMSVARIAGPAYVYLAGWLIVVAGFLWVSTIWSIVCAIRPDAASIVVVPRLRGATRSAPRMGLVCVVALLALALVASLTTSTARNASDTVRNRAVGRLAGPAERAVRGRGLVLVTASPVSEATSHWILDISAIESGLQAELQRRGVDVATTDDRAVLVGARRVLHGRIPGARLVVQADVGATPNRHPVPGTIGVFDSLSPADRRAFQGLEARRSSGHRLGPRDLARLLDLESRAVLYRLVFLDR